MREVYTEVYTGTGAALPIEIGFQPSYCEILTKTGGLVAMWHDSEPNYTRIVHPYVDRLLDDAVLQIGTTPTAVANLAFNYVIAGIPYTKGATAAGTAPGNDVIPQGLWGAVAFDIAADGTIDVVGATANATGYATAALARAGCAAAGASHVRIGFVAAKKSDGAFTFGTTSLAAANSTVEYTGSDEGLLTTTGIHLYGDVSGDSYNGIEVGTSTYINKVGEIYILKAYR